MRGARIGWLSGVVGVCAWFISSGTAQTPAPAPAAGNAEIGFTDTPLLPGLPYHVHDPARPKPPVVTPGVSAGMPSSDAVVLFDGRDLSRWSAAKLDYDNGTFTQALERPAPWKIENGYFEVVPGAGDIGTRDRFGDVQLHIEWAAPASARGRSQDRGNSGILLMGLYEIQVLDNFNNPTYADGTAGAIYGQWPPLVNPLRGPGQWQSYDIVFEAPRFEAGKLVRPAFQTVFINGIVVHNRKEVMGPMRYRMRPAYAPHSAEGPILLQDHNHPVRFRNIWARRLGGYDGKAM